jgi:hypothetical protein
MKHWEKILKLDSDYVEARKQLVLGNAVDVEITVHKNKAEPAVLLKKPKDATKPSTEKSI